MRIECPYCQQPYELSSEYEGKSVECQSCHKFFTVTAPVAPSPAPVVTVTSTGTGNGITGIRLPFRDVVRLYMQVLALVAILAALLFAVWFVWVNVEAYKTNKETEEVIRQFQTGGKRDPLLNE